MKKICILSNHIFPFHVGGSEIVIKNVSEELLKKGYIVTVYGWDVKEDISQNGVSIKRIFQDKFLSVLQNHDVIIVYSDAFINLINLIKINEKTKKKIILFPVGFTGANSSSSLMNAIKSNLDTIKFVCHDEAYVDAEFLRNNQISYSIIPNGINSNEFSKEFCEKKIGDPIKVFCVANTFPKKGHSELFSTCDIISKHVNISLSIYCNTPSWDVGKRLQQQVASYAKTRPYPVSVKIDKKRQEVVDSFYNNDVFLFCSLKEVAPLCILESCASGTPWVSFNVGNVSSLKGGLVNFDCYKDSSGYVVPSESLYKSQAELFLSLFKDDAYGRLSRDGYEFSKNLFWENIVDQYAKIIEDKG